MRARRHIRALGSIAAGFVGACALGVSMYTAFLQRKQVRAQVWPRLEAQWHWAEHGDEPEGRKNNLVEVHLINRGIGPAIIRGVTISVDDKPVSSWDEALDRLGAPKNRSIESTEHLVGATLSANQNETWFRWKSPEAPAFFERNSKRVSIWLCYCSVLDDCWTFEDDQAREIDHCPQPPLHR